MGPQLKRLFVFCLIAAWNKPTTVTAADPANPTEPTPVPAIDPASATEPTPVPATDPANATEPTPVPATDPANATEPTPVPATDPTEPVSPSIHPSSPNSVAPSSNPPTVPLTTEVPGICDSHPCGPGSTCEARVNETFVCLCRAGEFYNGYGCQSAQVFPGQLQVPSLTYVEEMATKTSDAFADAANQITEQLRCSFRDISGHISSNVLELKRLENKRSNSSGVNAAVELFFLVTLPITTQTFDDVMANASKCVNCILANSTFSKSDLCLKNPCQKETSLCSAEKGFLKCACAEGYIETDFSERMCVACPSGQKPNGSQHCMDCPYGQSGFNCNEKWQLALVVVGSVLGGLLLISTIVLIVMSCKSTKKTSKKHKRSNAEENQKLGHSYNDKHPLVDSPPANRQPPPVKTESADHGLKPFPSGGVPRIPRATASTAWDNGTNLEMTQSNGRHNAMAGGKSSWLNDHSDSTSGSPYQHPRNQTSSYDQTRAASNSYADSRPLNNPYTQDRPQLNPYARNQGQSNGNYSHDDGRPFNY
ncbi:mucin-13b [Nerophis lumbriciformis]|uniref:mucin-13b n=1 Tax=Nerophis lumbriciformis TaxID=546530 RepID=UPI002ADF9BC7|nr:mucin-13b [Nerophis lumbriciformis]